MYLASNQIASKLQGTWMVAVTILIISLYNLLDHCEKTLIPYISKF